MGTEFKDNVVLVAGGTGGLGRAVSLAFLAAGAHVVTTWYKAEEFDALKAEAGGAKLTGVNLDVTSESAVAQAVADLMARHGRLDVLVNTVGGWAGGKALWETEGRTLEQMLTLNLRAGFVLCHAVAPVLVRQGRGAIVNIAARAGVEPPSGGSAYAASKAAAIAMLDSLAADLKGTGVRANTILPSIIDTEANRRSMPGADYSKWPRPGEIARVVLFLCSDDAQVVHGASIPVYGAA
ncbi:MAG TPA: SDR family NAD(P)-dependent oxidoreductase [Burkholderiales bacterium]|nr:SDR family NAD(P)-dependent oxidoreductase [Burkholderiales bacterium]